MKWGCCLIRHLWKTYLWFTVYNGYMLAWVFSWWCHKTGWIFRFSVHWNVVLSYPTLVNYQYCLETLGLPWYLRMIFCSYHSRITTLVLRKLRKNKCIIFFFSHSVVSKVSLTLIFQPLLKIGTHLWHVTCTRRKIMCGYNWQGSRTTLN